MSVRRSLLAALAAGPALALHGLDQAWAQQGYPNRPLKLVVPFPPGGPTDIVARPFGQLIGESLRQPVVIENRGGAGGAIGATAVARSPADGYSLLMATVGTHAINGSLYKALSYQMVEDFTPIALMAHAPVVAVAGPAVPYTQLRDLLQAARAQPGQLAYGSAGNGTPGHLTGAMVASAAGIRLSHVPYKGSAPAVSDLLGGQIPLMFDPLQSVLPHIAAGKLKALAISSRTRHKLLPEVPTFVESGLAGLDVSAWWAVFAPARLPPELQRRLTEEAERVAASEEFAARLVPLGVNPHLDRTVSLAAFQRSEIVRWSRAVRDAGVSLD